MKSPTLHVAICREAFGVVVRDGKSLRALLVDGRVLSMNELVEAYPSLAGVVAALE